MFKIESYIGPLIMGYLNKYIKLDEQSFKLSLWGGDAIFHNLELQYDILEDLMPLPIGFKSGQVYEMKIHIPWTKLGSESVVVTLNTVECILTLKSDFHSHKLRKIKSSSSLKEEERMIQKEISQGYWKSYFNNIINNIHIVVNNLIIKFVEDDIVLSMNAKCLEYFPVILDWTKGWNDRSLNLNKSIKITDLTICLDQMDAAGHIPIYQEPICYRMSMEARFALQYASKMSQPCFIKVDLHVGDMNANLSGKQIQLSRRLIELMLALYYGTINWDSVVGCGFTNKAGAKMGLNVSETSTNQKNIEKSRSNTNLDEESESSQSWAAWAWSYVPSVFGDEGEEFDSDDNDENSKTKSYSLDLKEMKKFRILVLGIFVDSLSIQLKKYIPVTNKKSATKSINNLLLMNIECSKIGFNMVRKSLNFLNCQFGIHKIFINTAPTCICGVSIDNKQNCIGKFGLDNDNIGHYMNDYMTSRLFQMKSVNDVDFINDWSIISRLSNSPEDYESSYPLPTSTDQKLSWSTSLRTEYSYWLIPLQDDVEKQLEMENLFDADNIRESCLFTLSCSGVRLFSKSHSLHVLLEIARALDVSQYPSYFKQNPSDNFSMQIPTEEKVARIHEYVPMKKTHFNIVDLRIIIEPYIDRNYIKETGVCLQYEMENARLTRLQPIHYDKLINCISQLPRSLIMKNFKENNHLFDYCYFRYELNINNIELAFMISSIIDDPVTKSKTMVKIETFEMKLSKLINPDLWKSSETSSNINKTIINFSGVTAHLISSQIKTVIFILLSHRTWLLQYYTSCSRLHHQEIVRLDKIIRSTFNKHSQLIETCRPQFYRGQTHLLILEIPKLSCEHKNGLNFQIYGVSVKSDVRIYLQDTVQEHMIIPVLEAASHNPSAGLADKNLCCSLYCCLPAKITECSSNSTSGKLHVEFNGLSLMTSIPLLKWLSYPLEIMNMDYMNLTEYDTDTDEKSSTFTDINKYNYYPESPRFSVYSSCRCQCHILNRQSICASCVSCSGTVRTKTQLLKVISRHSADGSSHPDEFNSNTNSSSIIHPNSIPGRPVHLAPSQYRYKKSTSINTNATQFSTTQYSSISTLLFNLDLCIKLCRTTTVYIITQPDFLGWNKQEYGGIIQMTQCKPTSKLTPIIKASISRLALINSHRRYYLEDSFRISGNLSSSTNLESSSSSSSSTTSQFTSSETGLPWELVLHDARITYTTQTHIHPILHTPVSVTCSISASTTNWALHVDVTETYLIMNSSKLIQPILELIQFLIHQGPGWLNSVHKCATIYTSLLMEPMQLNNSNNATKEYNIKNTFWIQATLASIHVDLHHDDIFEDNDDALFTISLQLDDTTCSLDIQEKLLEAKLKLGSLNLKYSNRTNESCTVLKSGSLNPQISDVVNKTITSNYDLDKSDDLSENVDNADTTTYGGDETTQRTLGEITQKQHQKSRKSDQNTMRSKTNKYDSEELVRRHCMSISICVFQKKVHNLTNDYQHAPRSSSSASSMTTTTTATTTSSISFSNYNIKQHNNQYRMINNLTNLQISCVMEHWDCILTQELIKHTKLLIERFSQTIMPLVKCIQNNTVNTNSQYSNLTNEYTEPLFISENMPRIYFAMKSANLTIPVPNKTRQLVLSCSKVSLQPFSDNPIRRPPLISPLDPCYNDMSSYSHLLYDPQQIQLTIHGLCLRVVSSSSSQIQYVHDISPITLHGGQNPAFEWNNSINLSAYHNSDNKDTYFVLNPVQLQLIIAGAMKTPKTTQSSIDSMTDTRPIIGGYAMELNLVTEFDIYTSDWTSISDIQTTTMSLINCFSLSSSHTHTTTTTTTNTESTLITRKLCVPLDILITARRISLEFTDHTSSTPTSGLRVNFTQPHLLITSRRYNKWKVQIGLFELGCWRIMDKEEKRRALLEVRPGQPDLRTGVLEEFMTIVLETMSGDDDWSGHVKLARGLKLYIPTQDDLLWLIQWFQEISKNDIDNQKTPNNQLFNDSINNSTKMLTCSLKIETKSLLISIPLELLKDESALDQLPIRQHIRLEFGFSELLNSLIINLFSNDFYIVTKSQMSAFFLRINDDNLLLSSSSSLNKPLIITPIMIIQPTLLSLSFNYTTFETLLLEIYCQHLHINYPSKHIIQILQDLFKKITENKDVNGENDKPVVIATENEMLTIEHEPLVIIHDDSLRDGNLKIDIPTTNNNNNEYLIAKAGCINFNDNQMLWSYTGPNRCIRKIQVQQIPFVFIEYCGTNNDIGQFMNCVLRVSCRLEYWDHIRQNYNNVIGPDNQPIELLLSESETDSIVIPIDGDNVINAKSWRLVLDSTAKWYNDKSRIPIKGREVLVHLSPVLLAAAVCVDTIIRIDSSSIRKTLPSIHSKFDKFILEYKHKTELSSQISKLSEIIGQFDLIKPTQTDKELINQDGYNEENTNRCIRLEINDTNVLFDLTKNKIEFELKNSCLWSNSNPLVLGGSCIMSTNNIIGQFDYSNNQSYSLKSHLSKGIEIRVDKNDLLYQFYNDGIEESGVFVCNLCDLTPGFWIKQYNFDDNNSDKNSFKWHLIRYQQSLVLKFHKSQQSFIEIGQGRDEGNITSKVIVPCVYSKVSISTGINFPLVDKNNKFQSLLVIQQTLTPAIHRIVLFGGDTICYNRTRYDLNLHFSHQHNQHTNETKLFDDNSTSNKSMKIMKNSLPLSKYLLDYSASQLSLAVSVSMTTTIDQHGYNSKIEYHSSNTQPYIIYPGPNIPSSGYNKCFQFPIKLRVYKRESNDSNNTNYDQDTSIALMCCVEKLYFDTITTTLLDKGMYWKVNNKQSVCVLLVTFSHPITVVNLLPEPIKVRLWTNEVVRKECEVSVEEQLDNNCIESVIVPGFNGSRDEKSSKNMMGLLHSPMLTNKSILIDASIVSNDKDKSVIERPIQLDERAVLRGLSKNTRESHNYDEISSNLTSSPIKLLGLIEHSSSTQVCDDIQYTLSLKVSPWLILRNSTVYHLVLSMKLSSNSVRDELFYLEPGSHFLPPFTDRSVKLGIVVSSDINSDGVIWSQSIPIYQPYTEPSFKNNYEDDNSITYIDTHKFISIPSENDSLNFSWKLVLACHYVTPVIKETNHDQYRDTYELNINCPISINNKTSNNLMIIPIITIPNKLENKQEDFDKLSISGNDENIQTGKMLIESGIDNSWNMEIQFELFQNSIYRVKILDPLINDEGISTNKQQICINYFYRPITNSSYEAYQVISSYSNNSYLNIEIDHVKIVPIKISNFRNDLHMCVCETSGTCIECTETMIGVSTSIPYWPESYRYQLNRRSFAHSLYGVNQHNQAQSKGINVKELDVNQKINYTGPLRLVMGIQNTVSKQIYWSESFPIPVEKCIEKIQLLINNIKVTLRISVAQNIPGCNVLIEILSNENEILSNENEIHEQNYAMNINNNFDIKIDGISIILCDRIPRFFNIDSHSDSQKLLLATTRSTELTNQIDTLRLFLICQISINENQEKFNLQINEIRLDNLLANCGLYDFPIVFHASSNKSILTNGVCEIELMRRYMDNMWNIECCVRKEICVWLEDAFVYWLLSVMYEDIRDNMNRHNLRQNCDDKKTIALISWLCINWQSIKISSIPIDLTVHAHSTWKRFYVSCADSHIEVPGFEWYAGCCLGRNTNELSDLFMREISLVHNNSRFLILHCGWRLLAGAELIGNPAGLARSLTKALTTLLYGATDDEGNDGTNSDNQYLISSIVSRIVTFCKHTSGGVVSSVTGMADSLARNLDLCSLDEDHVRRREQERRENYHHHGFRDGFLWGMSGFGLSLLAAVGGLADHPLQETFELMEKDNAAKSEWVSGLLRGMLRGLAGVITKPCGGGAAWIAATGRGLLLSLGQNDQLTIGMTESNSLINNTLSTPITPIMTPTIGTYLIVWFHKSSTHILVLTNTDLLVYQQSTQQYNNVYPLAHYSLHIIRNTKDDTQQYTLQLQQKQTSNQFMFQNTSLLHNTLVETDAKFLNQGCPSGPDKIQKDCDWKSTLEEKNQFIDSYIKGVSSHLTLSSPDIQSTSKITSHSTNIEWSIEESPIILTQIIKYLEQLNYN